MDYILKQVGIALVLHALIWTSGAQFMPIRPMVDLSLGLKVVGTNRP